MMSAQRWVPCISCQHPVPWVLSEIAQAAGWGAKLNNGKATHDANWPRLARLASPVLSVDANFQNLAIFSLPACFIIIDFPHATQGAHAAFPYHSSERSFLKTL
jgi:hypothetical protein